MKFRERRSGVSTSYPLPSRPSQDRTDVSEGKGRRNPPLPALLGILAVAILAGAGLYYYVYGFEVAPWIPWVASTAGDSSDKGGSGEGGKTGSDGTESQGAPTPTVPVHRGPRFPVGYLVGAERGKQIELATADGVTSREPGLRRRFLLLSFSAAGDATGAWALDEFRYRGPRGDVYDAISYSMGRAKPFVPFSSDSGPEKLDLASVPAGIEEIVLLFEVPFLDVMTEGTFVWQETEVLVPEIKSGSVDQ